MTRHEFQRAMDFAFSHPVMKRRLANSIAALRRRNMDPETRGVVLGHLDIIDYFRDQFANDIWTDTGEPLEFSPDGRPTRPTLVTPPTDPETERVAPLSRKIGWDTR